VDEEVVCGLQLLLGSGVEDGAVGHQLLKHGVLVGLLWSAFLLRVRELGSDVGGKGRALALHAIEVDGELERELLECTLDERQVGESGHGEGCGRDRRAGVLVAAVRFSVANWPRSRAGGVVVSGLAAVVGRPIASLSSHDR
jgi:hypothetical protein